MKIDQVPKFWRNNTKAIAQTGNYWTDGYTLFSYKLKIGETLPGGIKILYNYTKATDNFISATTSRHVNLAAFYADEKLIPNIS
tara:strand:- start:854 stop:1105 length:252 start_codon:yes stop_codon:yes gene_type:complete